MRIRATWAALAALPLAACGGGSNNGPTGPTTPTPSPAGQSAVAVVYYDENGNGVLDPSEAVRLPNVEVVAAGRTARTESGTGRATIRDLPQGTHSVTVTESTLPPFYRAGALTTVQVPQPAGNDANVPVTLPIGSNEPNTYLAFGDSISNGIGYADENAYRVRLEEKLDAYFGRATVINDGAGSTRSNNGADRIGDSLSRYRPAYTLIVYGTNDWNRTECDRAEKLATCFTIPSLRSIVRSAFAAKSLPCLATLPPPNEGYDVRAPPRRTDWSTAINQQIRTLAAEEGALLVDLESAMLKSGDISELYVDHVHPNERGFEIIANTFLQAITAGHVSARPSASSRAVR
jgi:lysophospholipase L1-like esterase